MSNGEPEEDRSSWGPNLFSGRTVFVTGGTSGSGLRAAEQFLASGANVVINGRSQERGVRAREALLTVSPHVLFLAADAGNYEQISKALAESAREFGGVDVLVSAGASGKGAPKLFSDMSPEEVVEGFMSRFAARIYPLHAAIPYLKQRSGSNAVLLTTDAARHATSGESIIGAYGAGVIQLTKTLAKELSREKIRVNAVSMTLTSDTRTWDFIFENEGFEGRLFTKALERFPFGQPPSAADVADSIVFLASPTAGHITGQTLSVNGGLSYGGW